MMIFSARAFAFSLSLFVASFVANTNADCVEDLQSDEWTAFTSRLNTDGGEDLDIGNMCENAGGDIFGYSGNVTCDDAPYSPNGVQLISPPWPGCFPKSCTEGDHDLLAELVATRGPTGTDEDPSSCTGDYVFEALGDGYPVWFPCDSQCSNDLYSTTFETSILPFKTALQMAETSAGEGEDPDYSGLQEICEAIDGYDYFTYSGTHDCGYDENYEKVLKYVADVPSCLPTACTSSSTEDLRLKGYLVNMWYDVISFSECPIHDENFLIPSIGDLTFFGRDESSCGSDEGKHSGKASKKSSKKSVGTGVRGSGKTKSSKSTKGSKVAKKGKKKDAWEYPN